MKSTLNHNNGELAYEVWGSGEPIVFVHALTLDRRMWAEQVAHFSATNRVVTYDVRGFGESSVPVGPYRHTDDLKALLAELGITQAHIVGLSMGGRIGINFTLAYPDLVRTLTVMNPGLDGREVTIGWAPRAREVGALATKRAWLDHALFASAHDHPVVLAQLHTMIGDYSGWHWMHEDLQVPANIAAVHRLGEIAVPTLAVLGERDMPYFHGVTDLIASQALNAHKVVVPGAGHMVNMEAPRQVNKLVADFINRA